MKGGKSKSDAPKKADSKLSVKRKAAEKPSKKPAKSAKPGKDPNKPKRPPSAFFVFMEEFRETFKKKNPNVRQVSVVGKAGGDKWKSMSESEKAPFHAKAAKLKGEYDKKISTYNKKQSEGANYVEEEESDEKPKLNNNMKEDEDDDEEGGSEEDEDEDDDDDDDDE